MKRDIVTVGRLSTAAAALGAIAAAVALAAGSTGWTGDKDDPAVLGLVSLALAALMGLVAWTAPWADTTGRLLVVTAGLVGPALLGLTTAGLVWVPAALVGVVAGALALRLAYRRGSIHRELGLHWLDVLMGTLALVYVAFGVAGGGLAGLLGLAGAAAVLASLVQSHRDRRLLATAFLVLGAVPFAALAWWSVVIPFTAMLMLTIGVPRLIGRQRLPRGVL